MTLRSIAQGNLADDFTCQLLEAADVALAEAQHMDAASARFAARKQDRATTKAGR